VLRETLTVKIRRSGESDWGWLVKYVQVGMKVKRGEIPFTTPAKRDL
jgi:hypothetical protein